MLTMRIIGVNDYSVFEDGQRRRRIGGREAMKRRTSSLACEVQEISAVSAADYPPLLFQSAPRLAAVVFALTSR